MPSRRPALRRVELQYFDGCPNWQRVDRMLATLATELEFEVARQLVTDDADAVTLGFLGSPTILVDGRDVFPQADASVGLSCRIYSTPDGPAGTPTLDQLRHALAS